ncbi:5597_t:CDS:2 [Ambispora gerdemannii]|uniref:Dolichyl-diphosphooligosaccharide--protein glycosyltransferase subunit WBP1 n=1 Tax=Ambispora gerdemannii TaxID=144530 RepID=A0A9N8VEE0_9GLOM|nr:5597_t:CDS:2 [Ambispora gerdemannii]
MNTSNRTTSFFLFFLVICFIILSTSITTTKAAPIPKKSKDDDNDNNKQSLISANIGAVGPLDVGASATINSDNDVNTSGGVLLVLLVGFNSHNVQAKSATGERVLVLLDDEADKALYSQFFKTLEDRKYTFSYKTASDPKVDLLAFNERAFDHVINFAPKTKNYDNKVNPAAFIDFVNRGGNILLAASSGLSETIRDFAREFDIEFDDRDTSVIDHFNYDVSDSDGKHTLLVLDDKKGGFTNNSMILSQETLEGPPILYKGIGHKIGTVPLLTRVAWITSNTAYSYETKEDQIADQDPFILGSDISLVSALQARNNARVTFVGSLELFQDSSLNSPVQKINSKESHPKSGNQAFVDDLTKWTFQEKGVLKVTARRHHLEGEEEPLETYRIKDNIVYSIEISEYTNEKWQPFNGTDVQLEVIMLDPYIRRTLTPLEIQPQNHHNSRIFESHLQLPDVYGVFTFKVNYKRPGYSYIIDMTTVAVRPFRHNEYPRFILAAYPYYAGAASMSVGFLVFSTVWIFNKDRSATKEDKKNN